MRRPFPLVLALVLLASAPRAQDRFDGVPDGAAVAAEHLPILGAMLEGDAEGRAFLRDLARVAFYPATIQTPAHLVEAFALRDSTVAHADPRVEAYFMEEEDYDRILAFLEEAVAVGMEPATAEGFVFGVGPGAFLEEQVAALAPPDFALYQAFQAALSRSYNGEYPYAGMEDQRQLVVLGERLRTAHPDSPYADAIREEFEQAVLTFLSLHRAGGEWFVGPATTDYYPWASTDEAHRQFVAENTESRYHPAVEALLAIPPEVNETDGAVDAVVVATGTREEVNRRILIALNEGIDLLAALPLDDLGETFAAVYRYFPPDDPRVERAMEAARQAGLQPERRRITTLSAYGP